MMGLTGIAGDWIKWDPFLSYGPICTSLIIGGTMCNHDMIVKKASSICEKGQRTESNHHPEESERQQVRVVRDLLVESEPVPIDTDNRFSWQLIASNPFPSWHKTIVYRAS